MKIAIIFGNDGSDVRLQKTCQSLVALGHDVHFIGWCRRPDLLSDSNLDGVTQHVLTHRVPHRRSTLFGQVRFTIHAILTVMKLSPECVTAVNEDNVLRILGLKGFVYSCLVCEIYDSHKDKISKGRFFKNIFIGALCDLARWASNYIIVTDERRKAELGRFESKAKIIGNYPNDPGTFFRTIQPRGEVTVFVSGTISRSRGIDSLLKALVYAPDVVVVGAGWLCDEFSESKFRTHLQVRFVGSLSPQASLEMAAESDVILAMYEPNCKNNIMASPNKIYDAMSVGRPCIINSEALVSKWISAKNLGYVVDYDDEKELGHVLGNLAQSRTAMLQDAERKRQLFDEGYSWESVFPTLAEIYGKDETVFD